MANEPQTNPRLAAALAHNEQMGGSRMIAYDGMQILAPDEISVERSNC